MEVFRKIQGELQRTANGWTDSAMFFVCDVGGTPSTRRSRALTHSEIPQYGSAHPDGIAGLRVSSITSAYDLEDPDQVVVTVNYSGDAVGQTEGLEGTGIKGIEVNTSTVSMRATRDYDGNLMVVVYEGDEVTIPGVNGGVFSASTEDQVVRAVTSRTAVEAEFDLPATTVVVTTESNRPSHIRSQQLSTKTNAGRWSGLDSNQWLSLGIDSNLNQAGTYDWRHIFAIAPKAPDNDTWLFRAEDVFVANALRLHNTRGNGIEFFQLYEPINFASSFGFEIPG